MKFRKHKQLGWLTHDSAGRVVGVAQLDAHLRTSGHFRWTAQGLGSDKRIGFGATRAAAVRNMR